MPGVRAYEYRLHVGVRISPRRCRRVVRNNSGRRREIEQALFDYSTEATVRGDYYRSGGWDGYNERAADWDET